MYTCLNCQHDFDKPEVIIDVENDEQYDVCIYCKSDDIIEDNKLYQNFLNHES